MDRKQLIDLFSEKILENLEFAQACRKTLHQYPCISGEEAPTAQMISDFVPLAWTTVADVGLMGRVGPQTGQAIALRAELDALPLQEQTGVPFASSNSAMHACGHDVHQAALIAVIRAAREIELPYGLVPIFQPREETYPSGALDIVNSGALAEQQIEAIAAAHVHPSIATGYVTTGKTPINAAADEIRIIVTGQGGHGAYPHQANNPLIVLANIASGINEMLTRTISPMHPVVFSVGALAGGEAANVIPDCGELRGTLRTMYTADREKAEEAITRFAESLGQAYGAQVAVEVINGEPVLDNNPQLVDSVDSYLSHLDIQIDEPLRSCGADDFSFYSSEIPGIMAFVGVKNASDLQETSLHQPQFLPDEDAVRRVALTLAAAYVGACDFIDSAPTSQQ
ncbi:M20 metallopeptidase family protein [Rothia amarae]|uniref:M20 metallopeptidase family protein n=1 Tax=Rothia amarae TaxID=169480 RepID=UPI0012454957